MDKDVHVMPENDLHEHTTSVLCPCHPKVERSEPWEAGVVIHNSWDGREIRERAEDYAQGAMN